MWPILATSGAHAGAEGPLRLGEFAAGEMFVYLRGVIGPGLAAVQHRHAKASFDVASRTGARNLEDILALYVSPLAKQDLNVGRLKIEWPK